VRLDAIAARATSGPHGEAGYQLQASATLR
jgi:hypothetical protein